MKDDTKELDSNQTSNKFDKTLFGSLSKTFKSVLTPSWLTELVKTVKETANAETPSKKEEMEVVADYPVSMSHPKSIDMVQMMADTVPHQRRDTLKDNPIQHFSSQKGIYNYGESTDTSARKNGGNAADVLQSNNSGFADVLQSNNSGFCPPPCKKICNSYTKSTKSEHLSPYYSGKTRFGGALSQNQRMNNSTGNLGRNYVPYVVKQKIKARTRTRSSTSSAKKILETLHKLSPSYDLPVELTNGKTEFTLPEESIARLSYGLFDEKREISVNNVKATKGSGFTFSSPAQKKDILTDNCALPTMDFTFRSPISIGYEPDL